MKKLTAYNRDVQKYMQSNELSSKRKSVIIEGIEKKVINNGISFEHLFPARSKRKEVLDHIVYLLSGNGICKIGATTLADKADCSVRTVNEAVKHLKTTGEIIVAGLADGKNKYIFVLKSHPNFKQIIKDVFYINAEQITEQVAEQKNAESVEAVSLDNEKSSSNHYNSIISKQENAIISDSIENELSTTCGKLSPHEREIAEFEKVCQYYVCDFQFDFYHHIKSASYSKEIKDVATILGLRIGSDCTEFTYNLALKVIYKIDRFINTHGLDSIDNSIQALFSHLYKLEIHSYVQNKKQQELERQERNEREKDLPEWRKGVPFYNWLEN